MERGWPAKRAEELQEAVGRIVVWEGGKGLEIAWD